MNGAHDLGGQHGLGLVEPEPEIQEPVFHNDWERRAFAITLACGFLGQWNIDEARHARECQDPIDYLRNSYYENWLAGLETLLLKKGMITREELQIGKTQKPTDKYRVPDVKKVSAILASGGPTRLRDSRESKFQLGDQVGVYNNHPLNHTRVPRYTRGCVGRIARLHGVHVFPDENAKGNRQGQHLYSVQFEAEVLWGENTESCSSVYVDLWEPYLKAA